MMKLIWFKREMEDFFIGKFSHSGSHNANREVPKLFGRKCGSFIYPLLRLK